MIRDAAEHGDRPFQALSRITFILLPVAEKIFHMLELHGRKAPNMADLTGMRARIEASIK